ncbi:hypothetical protein LINPERPRIM_LOCUS35515 [Linum perenne]
MDAVL